MIRFASIRAFLILSDLVTGESQLAANVVNGASAFPNSVNVGSL